jgi:hypothetical protein
MDDFQNLAALLRQMNAIGEEISRIIQRPALTGHLGEFVASRVFNIDLEPSANSKGIDGRFRDGPLAGKSVNIKCYLKLETLDINPNAIPDYYLVLSGPRSKATNSKGATRPFVISHVFLFDTSVLIPELESRPVRLQTGTSLLRRQWENAEIFPSVNPRLYELTDAQRAMLTLFSPPDA